MTRNNAMRINAARFVAIVFGVFSGLGGIRHGIGEILQGNVTPDSIYIDSWTQGAIATKMGGEPGFTVIPNMLITGILAISVSLVIIAWSLLLLRRAHGGPTLLLLSVALLLVGGGVGPPVTGLIGGAASLAADAEHTWWRAHLSTRARQFLAGIWPWIMGLGVINGLFLFVVSVILVFLTEFSNEGLFLNSFYLSVVLGILAALTGIVRDTREHGAETKRSP